MTYCGGYMTSISPITLAETAGSAAHTTSAQQPACPPEQPNCPQTTGLAPDTAVSIKNKSWIA